jgi:hypothetical protein
VATGLDAQIGFAEETVYGTPVVVTRFFELLNEGVKTERPRQESQGLRAGARLQRSGRWVSGAQNPAGAVSFELGNKGFGMLLKHMFGGVATSTPGGGTLTRDHTFTPASLDALSMTMQIGKPPSPTALALPFTYHGSKVAEWELKAAVDDIPSLELSMLAEEEDVATALAVASYASGFKVFPSVDVSLSVAGAAVLVTEVTLKGNNALKDDRFFIGSTMRRNPLEVGLREVSGSFEGEFESMTAYNRFVAGTEAALVITMLGDIIEGALRYTLSFTCNVRFDGETPVVGGPEIVTQPMQFKCINTGASDATAITCVYRTTDVTP